MTDERVAPATVRADELVFAVPLQATTTTTIVRRGPRGGRGGGTGPTQRDHARFLLVVIVVVMALGVGALITRGNDAVDPDTALAGAQAAFQGDDPYRLVATVGLHEAEPEDEDAPVESGVRTTAEVVSPTRWRATDAEFADSERYETLERRRVDDELFVLERGSGATTWMVLRLPPPPTQADQWAADLADAQAEDYEPDEADLRRLGLAFMAHVYPIVYDPAQVERLVLQATDPVVEERLEDDAVRLRVTVAALPEMEAVADDPIEPMALVLDLDRERRPQAATFRIEADGNTAELDLAFSDWGAPLTVDPPGEDDVDRTPWVDEAALGDVDPALFVVPDDLPDGLELVSVEVDEAEGEDDEDCSTVDLEYSTREQVAALYEDYEEPAGPSLHLFVYQLACDELLLFDEELGGRPATEVDEGRALVRVGDVAVDIDSSLDDEELEDLVALLEQVAPEELLARFPAWLPEVVQTRYD